jgi:hypothetical protein
MLDVSRNVRAEPRHTGPTDITTGTAPNNETTVPSIHGNVLPTSEHPRA